jgi:hypothetical protein
MTPAELGRPQGLPASVWNVFICPSRAGGEWTNLHTYGVTSVPFVHGVGCASDIDPDPFWAKWRYREADPITKL